MLGGAFAGIFHHDSAGLVIVGMAAVFGGAARVPIATLLMVAEMTGGYQLLVPAGLAVMLSFLIQINLSSFLKYGSLYEAQVAARAGFAGAPRGKHPNRAAIAGPGQSYLAAADESPSSGCSVAVGAIALDLPDGSQLVTGALRPESPWVGKQLQSRKLDGPLADSKVLAILRGKSVLAVSAEIVLQPGDRLLLVVPSQSQIELGAASRTHLLLLPRLERQLPPRGATRFYAGSSTRKQSDIQSHCCLEATTQ